MAKVRKSSWLVAAQGKTPSIKPCPTCSGSGWANQSTGATCTDCNGFGY